MAIRNKNIITGLLLDQKFQPMSKAENRNSKIIDQYEKKMAYYHSMH